MFNKWLTQQEKDAFISQLESDGWVFQKDVFNLSYAGTDVEMYGITGHPVDVDDFNKLSWMKIIASPVEYKWKLELYDTPSDHIKKKSKKDKQKEKDEKDKKPK